MASFLEEGDLFTEEGGGRVETMKLGGCARNQH
jgi:hypothetical protein